MADGKSKCIRRIVLREFDEIQQRFNHSLDLRLLRKTITANRLLHAPWLVLVNWKSDRRSGCQHSAACLPEDKHRPRVLAVNHGFYRHDIRTVLRNQFDYP